MTEAPVTEDGTAKVSDIVWGLYPTRGLGVKFAKFLQFTVLIFS